MLDVAHNMPHVVQAYVCAIYMGFIFWYWSFVYRCMYKLGDVLLCFSSMAQRFRLLFARSWAGKM